MHATPSDWNLLKSKLKLQNLQSLDHFKTGVRQMEADSEICNCFKCVCVV